MLALADLEIPIVQAPLAGGPSTPALAAAVSGAGGLGMLAAGYKTVEQVEADVAELRVGTGRPFGINLFAPPGGPADPGTVVAYADELRDEGDLGTARHDDDAFEAKLGLVLEERPAVVSFTFGCPKSTVFDVLRAADIAAWVTITTPAEASTAADAGADALIAQGVEAGGHRGSFDDTQPGDLGLLALLQLTQAATPDTPLVAAGAIMTGRAIAAVLAAGAQAAQLGTALMRTPEAGTAKPHRAALRQTERTGLTRAFSGRTARGILNRFQRAHPDAPSAYPEVHHLTSPMRAVARAAGDPERINLWAGQAYPLAQDRPAAELVQELAEDARARLRELGS
jgi:nitronate monooxygenase